MYLVLGLGKSGFATAAFLKVQELPFVIFDDSEKGRTNALNLGYTLFTPEHWSTITHIITGPGIPFDYPAPHLLIQEARKRNIPIITDCTLLQEYASHAKYIGITGTNGKSTTTALIAHILQQAGVKAVMGGNIGTAALSLPLDQDVYVLELSSFQLERSPAFKFDISLWTNVTEDHLEQHGTMESYVAAKEKVFQNAHHKVICIDDPWSAAVAERYKEAVQVSTKAPLSVDLTPLLTHPTLKGEHNLQNMLMAYHALKAYGLPHATILGGILSFKGLAHRQQFIATHKHITFINDSKATSAAATEHALRAYDNIYWLLGGKAKTDGIEPLSPYFNKVTKAYAFGAAKERFCKTLEESSIPCVSLATIDDALLAAYHDAQTNTEAATLLLSPAGASYDQFADFEARGDHFMEQVKNLLSK